MTANRIRTLLVGLAIVGGIAASRPADASVTLPDGIVGARMNVYRAYMYLGAWHLYGLITTGPYAGYYVERDSSRGAVLTLDPLHPASDGILVATDVTIVNNIVASGYYLGTANCSFLIVELSRIINPMFYPGLNNMTMPSSVPPPGEPMSPPYISPFGWTASGHLNTDAGFGTPGGTAAQYWYAYGGGQFPGYDQSESQFWNGPGNINRQHY